MSKYNKQQIIDNHTEFVSKGDAKLEELFDKLWTQIVNASKMGNKRASYELGWAYDNMKNDAVQPQFDYLSNRLKKIGQFQCELKVAHCFQCDCDQKNGCKTFIVVTWDPATL